MSSVRDRWSEIESTSDPDSFLRFLDRTSTQPGERHPGLALLELEEDQTCLDIGCGLGEDARAIGPDTRLEGIPSCTGHWEKDRYVSDRAETA